jgi:hypothetical protein
VEVYGLGVNISPQGLRATLPLSVEGLD